MRALLGVDSRYALELETIVSARKLPDPEVVNRLYWLDGLSGYRIAEFAHSSPIAVYAYMRRHGIPRRSPAAHRRITEIHCLECSKPVSYWKQWRRGKYVWALTKRCVEHQSAYLRQLNREANRRRHAIDVSRWRGSRSSTIRADVRAVPPGL